MLLWAQCRAQTRRSRENLLTCVADAAVSSGFEGTSHFLSVGDFAFGKVRCVSFAVSVVDAALIQGAEIVGGFQSAFPRFAIHEACGTSV
jgi:hypothetical protein